MINTQSQLKQSVTAKRCKVFSPTFEPDQKVCVVENRSSARSRAFVDDQKTKPESNIPSSVLQNNHNTDTNHILIDPLPVTANNPKRGPQPLTKRSPVTATVCDPDGGFPETTGNPEGGVPVTSGRGVITANCKGGIPVTTSNLKKGVAATTSTPKGGTPATTSTRDNANPMATTILSQASLRNPELCLRKAFTSSSRSQTLTCFLKVLHQSQYTPPSLLQG